MGFQKRLLNLRKLMAIHRFDSMLVSSREDIFYYTGYKAPDGNVLIVHKSGAPALFVSPLENDAERVRGADLVYLKSIEQIAKNLKHGLAGYDEFSLSANRFLGLHKYHARLKKASSFIKKPREAKDEQEIENIKKAIKITKKVLEQARFYNKMEVDVANKIEAGFKLNGADKAFDTIVANGTASIHHIPDHTTIKNTKPTIFDLGARYNWYCCDVTRTYLGRSGKFWKAVWEDVSEMQQKIIEAVKPGISMEEIQKLYEKLAAEKKYKVYHSFGHGLGLDVHEQVTGKLKEGMVITVEPGVYLKHKGGVRIEDTILVRKGKPAILSKIIRY